MSVFGDPTAGAGLVAQSDPFGLEQFNSSIAGAGFAEAPPIDPEITLDELAGNSFYADNAGLLGQLRSVPNAGNINFSDSLVDLDKFGINYDIPLDIGFSSRSLFGGEGILGMISTDGQPANQWGNIRLNGNDIQKLINGNWVTVDRWGENDRDATDIMGWVDPRRELIMSDAPGWNDPLSNYLQSLGEENMADMFGKLSYRARVGDSSSAGFTPETFWIQRMPYEDANRIFGVQQADYDNLQNWAREYFSSGAQSARHDAMFGDSFSNFLSDIAPIAAIAGMAFGLPALFEGLGGLGAATAADTAAGMLASQAASDLAMGFSLADVGLGLEGIGGLSGLGASGLSSLGLGAGALAEMGMSVPEALALSDYATFGTPGLEALGQSLGYGASEWAPMSWQSGMIDTLSSAGVPYNSAASLVDSPLGAWNRDPFLSSIVKTTKGVQALNRLGAPKPGDLLMAKLLEDARARGSQDNYDVQAHGRAPSWLGRNNFSYGVV